MENYREKELERQNKKLTILLISAVTLLLLSIVGNAFLLGKNRKGMRTQINLTARIDSVEFIKNTSEKELLAVTQRNRELLERIDLNQQEISNLTESITQKNARIAYLSRFQAEALELKKQLRNQDSLINELDRISGERARFSRDLSELRNKHQTLEEEKNDLESRAKIAAPLRAYNVCTQHARVSRSGKQRPFLTARRINQTEVSFEIPDNPFAVNGSKTIHLILSGPNGKIINGDKAFTPSNSTQALEFSDSGTIAYEGNRIIQKFTVRHGERPLPGKYSAKVYIDGVLSGEKEFSLN